MSVTTKIAIFVSVLSLVAGVIEAVRSKGATEGRVFYTIVALGVFIVFIDLLFSWVGCKLSFLECRAVEDILVVSEIGILKGAAIIGYFLISLGIGGWVGNKLKS